MKTSRILQFGMVAAIFLLIASALQSTAASTGQLQTTDQRSLWEDAPRDLLHAGLISGESYSLWMQKAPNAHQATVVDMMAHVAKIHDDPIALQRALDALEGTGTLVVAQQLMALSPMKAVADIPGQGVQQAITQLESPQSPAVQQYVQQVRTTMDGTTVVSLEIGPCETACDQDYVACVRICIGISEICFDLVPPPWDLLCAAFLVVCYLGCTQEHDACLEQCASSPGGQCQNGCSTGFSTFCPLLCDTMLAACAIVDDGPECLLLHAICETQCEQANENCKRACSAVNASSAEASVTKTGCKGSLPGDASLITAPFPWQRRDLRQKALVELATVAGIRAPIDY